MTSVREGMLEYCEGVEQENKDEYLVLQLQRNGRHFAHRRKSLVVFDELE